jgi:hypothetical protein
MEGARKKGDQTEYDKKYRHKIVVQHSENREIQNHPPRRWHPEGSDVGDLKPYYRP